MIFGYGRVSTNGQDLDGQLQQLKSAGCGKVYSEKMSGARTDRPELGKLMKRLEPGDTVIVTAIDRLARSTRDLLNILDTVNGKGAKFKSLSESWCDTSTPVGELVATILGGIATFERHLIIKRTSEGRARARAKGVRFGPKPKLTEFQRREAIRRLAAGEQQLDVARSFAVSQATISRLVPIYKAAHSAE